MNLRNIDGSESVNFTNGSHKKILFDCDVCGKTVSQPCGKQTKRVLRKN